jgi:hypothetical protein
MGAKKRPPEGGRFDNKGLTPIIFKSVQFS